MHLFLKINRFYKSKISDFSTEITTTGTKNLLFEPVEKFSRNQNIKILKIDFNTDLAGIGTNAIGSIDLTGHNTGVGTTTVGVVTSTILEVPDYDFNSLYANIFVQDSISKEINYSEVIVDFDGTDTTIAETYVDTTSGLSSSIVGIITAKVENNLVKLQIENDKLIH